MLIASKGRFLDFDGSARVPDVPDPMTPVIVDEGRLMSGGDPIRSRDVCATLFPLYPSPMFATLHFRGRIAIPSSTKKGRERGLESREDGRGNFQAQRGRCLRRFDDKFKGAILWWLLASQGGVGERERESQRYLESVRYLFRIYSENA